jgi:hypothetical protein
MTPAQYRHHRTLGGPFRSGELAGLGGQVTLDANPYRRPDTRRDPTRGAWSEGYIRAWAVGWREGDKQHRALHGRQAAPATTEGAEC